MLKFVVVAAVAFGVAAGREKTIADFLRDFQLPSAEGYLLEGTQSMGGKPVAVNTTVKDGIVTCKFRTYCSYQGVCK